MRGGAGRGFFFGGGGLLEELRSKLAYSQGQALKAMEQVKRVPAKAFRWIAEKEIEPFYYPDPAGPPASGAAESKDERIVRLWNLPPLENLEIEV